VKSHSEIASLDICERFFDSITVLRAKSGLSNAIFEVDLISEVCQVFGMDFYESWTGYRRKLMASPVVGVLLGMGKQSTLSLREFLEQERGSGDLRVSSTSKINAEPLH